MRQERRESAREHKRDVCKSGQLINRLTNQLINRLTNLLKSWGPRAVGLDGSSSAFGMEPSDKGTVSNTSPLLTAVSYRPPLPHAEV